MVRPNFCSGFHFHKSDRVLTLALQTYHDLTPLTEVIIKRHMLVKVVCVFLEKEDDSLPLHPGDAYGHFINYSHKTLQNQYNSKTKAAV